MSIAGTDFVIHGSDGLPIDHDETDGDLGDPGHERSRRLVRIADRAGPSIDKQVSDVGVNPISCAGTYIDTIASSFGPGDIVCWQLTVTFATGVHANSARVADFLPIGSDYVAGSATPTASNTAPIAALDSSSPGYLLWTLGDASGYVQPGATFQVRFASRLTGAQDALGDIKGNLMKFSDANTAGMTFPLRDLANFKVTKPVLALAKGVLNVNGTAIPGAPKDGVTANGGRRRHLRGRREEQRRPRRQRRRRVGRAAAAADVRGRRRDLRRRVLRGRDDQVDRSRRDRGGRDEEAHIRRHDPQHRRAR